GHALVGVPPAGAAGAGVTAASAGSTVSGGSSAATGTLARQRGQIICRPRYSSRTRRFVRHDGQVMLSAMMVVHPRRTRGAGPRPAGVTALMVVPRAGGGQADSAQ